jgi:hypothetical protein
MAVTRIFHNERIAGPTPRIWLDDGHGEQQGRRPFCENLCLVDSSDHTMINGCSQRTKAVAREDVPVIWLDKDGV